MPQPRSGDFDLPGVTRSRQKRSREMTLALLQAGAEMLRTRSLAELSIEALCSEVGAGSVGSVRKVARARCSALLMAGTDVSSNSATSAACQRSTSQRMSAQR